MSFPTGDLTVPKSHQHSPIFCQIYIFPCLTSYSDRALLAQLFITVLIYKEGLSSLTSTTTYFTTTYFSSSFLELISKR